jgi:hypothetical protein
VILASTTKVDGTYLQLLAGLAPMALGMGMTFVPLTLIATSGVDNVDAGLASGVFNTSQQIGGALGLAILATFAVNKTNSVLTGLSATPSQLQQATALCDGFQTAFIVAAALMLAGLVLVSVVLRKEDVAEVHLEEGMPVPA